jgi:pimeloyl-ACP methyl ester carboxylesterase
LGWRRRHAAFPGGSGSTAEDFQPLAARFTDRFHVLGLTRRGQGQSDKPESGYDTSQLVEDIRAFLGAKRIQRATLVGYSMAGNELTEFALRHPRRLRKLVYLDAAYDLPQNVELGRKAHLDLPALPGQTVPRWRCLPGPANIIRTTGESGHRRWDSSLPTMTLRNRQRGMKLRKQSC